MYGERLDRRTSVTNESSSFCWTEGRIMSGFSVALLSGREFDKSVRNYAKGDRRRKGVTRLEGRKVDAVGVGGDQGN